MDCREFRTFIQAYLDKELPRKIEKIWHQHLHACVPCRNEVRVFKKCIEMLQHFMGAKTPPKILREKLKQKLGYDCADFCLPAGSSEHDKQGD